MLANGTASEQLAPHSGFARYVMEKARTHRFAIKVWQEDPPEAGQGATWRGWVKHAADGEPWDQMRYVETLEDVTDFIAPYLTAMGVRFSLGTRLWLVLLRRSRRAKPWPSKRQPKEPE